jgi:hypothetical protein
MNEQQRIAEYLAKVKEAEEQAAKTIDPISRQAWEKIAERYRDMIRHARYPN